ncbi:MAG TPA: class I SAM-dependent methyltransferase [Longilinea sp.]|nr:class I SAM-dependent methyltransferase [Longilinea sp.]
MKPVIDHFGLLAPLYERFITPKLPEKMLSLVNAPEGGMLLDVGGGTGRVAQFFVGTPRLIVVADLSIKMVLEVRKKTGLQPVCSYSEVLPFEDGVFDRIIMVDAFHHVTDQAATARELFRLVKPGGMIVIEEPDYRFFSTKLIALAEKMVFMRSHFLSPAAIANLFPYPKAVSRIETENSTSWIMILKSL